MATGEEHLRKFLQDIAKKENYDTAKIEITPITSGGASYTADLYLATISEPPKKDINIFAKVANLNDNFREAMNFNAYEVEATFYSELAAGFERNYNKHNVPVNDKLILPKYYGHIMTPGKEILILENLQLRGFENFNRMKTFDWEYAATAVTQLAKFHAAGLSFSQENSAEFETYVKKCTMAMHVYYKTLKNFLQTTLESGLGGLDSDQKQRLLGYFSSMEHMRTLMTEMAEDKTMLIHGDFRPNNLMHRRRDDKLEVIPLDWQTMRMGNPVVDLLYFIFSGSDEEFRHLHYRNLVNHYFKELTLALQQLDIDIEKVYPKKTFDAKMHEMLPWGLFAGLILVVGATVDPDDVPAVGEDLSNVIFKPSKLAEKRIAGIVKDFINWGVL